MVPAYRRWIGEGERERKANLDGEKKKNIDKSLAARINSKLRISQIRRTLIPCCSKRLSLLRRFFLFWSCGGCVCVWTFLHFGWRLRRIAFALQLYLISAFSISFTIPDLRILCASINDDADVKITWKQANERTFNAQKPALTSSPLTPTAAHPLHINTAGLSEWTNIYLW